MKIQKRLIFIWFENYRNLEDISLNLSSTYNIKKEKNKIVLKKGNTLLNHFYQYKNGDGKVTNIDFCAIVGENGVGKTAICEYLSTSREYGDGKCIYIFEEFGEERTKLYIYFVNCTPNKNSLQEKIDIEFFDLQIEYECIMESFEGMIVGCDIISRENIKVIYLSNALNFKDKNVVNFESSGYDRTVSGNIVRNSYDMSSYYASQFVKQMKFLEEMKLLEEYEINKGIKFGEKFTIKFPKVVDVRIPKCTQINLNMNFKALNEYENLKQFNTNIIEAISYQHYETQFLIMLIL